MCAGLCQQGSPSMRATAVCVVLTMLVVGFAPRSAHACSFFGKAILSSLPETGAVDVPTDIAPIIRGYWDPTSLEWESEAGTPVEFDLRSSPGIRAPEGRVAEFVPRAPLQPNTRYVIRAFMMGDGNLEPNIERLEFTTGEDVASDDPLVQPSIAPTILTGYESGCISAAAIGCIAVGDTALLLEIDDPSGKLLARDVVTGDVTAHITKNPGCVRAFRRSASGKLSEATEICGQALSTRPIRRDDLDFLTCTFGRPRASDAGTGDAGEPETDNERFDCSVARPAITGNSVVGGLLLLVVATLQVRRVRRVRSRPRSLH
jgi:hypothetical protein